MTESEELALYRTTTAWTYEFLLGIDQQLQKSLIGKDDSNNSTDSQNNDSRRLNIFLSFIVLCQ